MNPIAEQLTFVPETHQLFLWSTTAGDGPLFPQVAVGGGQATAALSERLRGLGWPATARIVQGGGQSEPVAGVLIELIDALPVLCAAAATEVATAPTTLAGWAVVARAAMDLLARGGCLPRLAPRCAGPGDGRTSGWEARWSATCATPAERARLSRLSRCLGAPQTARVLNHKGRARGGATVEALSSRGLLLRVLDACADMLVREAARRGGAVRLGGIPADAWEQRLVRALGDDEATFSSGSFDARALAGELSTWTQEQTAQVGRPVLLGLADSPPTWNAAEPLRQVVTRMVQPAQVLAQRLLAGEVAPRTLPAPPALPVSRLSQAVAVTRTILQLTGTADRESRLGSAVGDRESRLGFAVGDRESRLGSAVGDRESRPRAIAPLSREPQKARR